MILRTLAIATLLAPAAHAADFDRTLPVSSPADLYIATGSGSIRIHPGDDSSIHVRAHLHANGYSGGDVDGRMTSISQNPPIRQSGNTIRIGDVDPEQRRLYNNITIDYEITAPRGVALNIRSGSGDLEIDHLGRFLKAETSSGSVRAHGIAGPADLSTGSGDIELQQEAGGDVKAHTGSGSIRVNGLQGSLDANTGSGDIEANGRLTGPARIVTGSGSVRLHLGQNARFDVDASTGSGSIRLPGQSGSSSGRLSMPVNGGGPRLQIQSGSGDIEVN